MNLKWGFRWVLILAGMLMAVPMAGAQSADHLYRFSFVFPGPDQARDVFNAGVILFDEGRYADAEKKFREVIRRFPKNAIADRTEYYLIRSLVKLGKVPEALNQIGSFTKIYPRSSWLSDVIEERLRLTHEITPERAMLILAQAPSAPPTPPRPPAPQAPPAATVPPAPPSSSEELADRTRELAERVTGRTGRIRAPNTFQFRPARVQITDPEVNLQQEVLRVLFENNADRAIDIATDRLNNDPVDPVVLSNLYMVAGSRSEKALPMLTTIAKSSANMTARKDAIFWISRSRAEKDAVVDVLLGVLPSADDEEAEAVAFALSQVNNDKSMTALGNIARDKDKSEKARENAIFWISQSKVPNRTSILENIYKDSSENAKVRRQITFALSRTKDPQAVTVLGNIAANDPDIEVRKQAAFFLGQIKTPEALQQLENLLRKK